jgi:hypothetical protein
MLRTHNLSPSPAETANVQFDRALIKNLRGQSPYSYGVRNKDFVNPSLASNEVFYDHYARNVQNPHKTPDRMNKSGYNLNNYVLYNPVPVEKEQTVRRDHSQSQKSLPKVNDEKRSVTPDRHYDRRSRSSRALSETRGQPPRLAPNPYNHQQQQAPMVNQPVGNNTARSVKVNAGINQFLQAHEPEHYHNDIRTNLQSQHVQNNQHHRYAENYQHTETHHYGQQQHYVKEVEVRDGHYHQIKNNQNHNEVQYDAKELNHLEQQLIQAQNNLYNAQVHKVNAQVHKVNAQETVKIENRHAQIIAPAPPSQYPPINLVAMKSHNVDPKALLQHSGQSVYTRPSTNVSQPDNLVCDNCLNHKIHDDKLNDLQKQRENDKDFVRRIDENARKQALDEKQRHFEKMRLYQEAITQQKEDINIRKHHQQIEQEKEKERIRRMMMNRDDELARLQKEQEKKLYFINDLKNQIDAVQAKRQAEAQHNLEIDRQTPNLLIDDAWRQQHRHMLQQHYRDNLIEQLNDVTQDKQIQKQAKLAEEIAHRNYAEQVAARQDELLRQKEAQKRELFKQTIKDQLQDKQAQNDYERYVKTVEDDNLKIKLENDHAIARDNALRRQKIMKEYLNDLGQQMEDLHLARKVNKEEDRRPGLNTLPLPEKHDKCYNCKVCQHKYPLKLLNKKKKGF